MNNGESTPTTQARRTRKLHPRYTPLVFAFFMAAIMGFFMCSVIVAVQSGFHAGYGWDVLRAYTLALPVAFCCVIVVRPLVMRLVPLIVDI